VANADEFIAQMPEGYDTIAANAATPLSGVSVNEFAIAMRSHTQCSDLILDEPLRISTPLRGTGFLKRSDGLMKGRHPSFIAHRLATVRKAM